MKLNFRNLNFLLLIYCCVNLDSHVITSLIMAKHMCMCATTILLLHIFLWMETCSCHFQKNYSFFSASIDFKPLKCQVCDLKFQVWMQWCSILTLTIWMWMIAFKLIAMDMYLLGIEKKIMYTCEINKLCRPLDPHWHDHFHFQSFSSCKHTFSVSCAYLMSSF